MKKFYFQTMLAFFGLLLSVQLSAQTVVSGTVIEQSSGDPLIGVNITVKGTVLGTVTDARGNFSLTVRTPPPFTLVVSYIGYAAQQIEITGSQSGLNIALEDQVRMGNEVVISASRVEESIMESPVSIQKMDILAIQQAPAADFYDQIKNLKGVYSSNGSLNFTTLNTRGFAGIANVRFVQLIDGVDMSAPTLNFPTGSIMSFSELDAESVELVPGAASALYGPNAFNGILMMNSRSPFEYQGLSAFAKVGVTNSQAAGQADPYYDFSMRYAKAFNNKFAFKVNFSYMQATDWRANDYTTFRTDVVNPTAFPLGAPNFDGLNTYGDETPIPLPTPIGTIRRTGWREQDILDNNDARTIRGDIGLHYRINDKMELSYAYRIGSGSTVYQGGERYALRDFAQQSHKLELKGANFFARAYMTQTDAGNSYNLTALGAISNESLFPTVRQPGVFAGLSAGGLENIPGGWAGAYISAFSGLFAPFQIPAGNHAAARAFADAGGVTSLGQLGTPAFVGGLSQQLQGAGIPALQATALANAFATSISGQPRPAAGTPEFNELMNRVRGGLFQTPSAGLPLGGAGFTDNSRLFHGEFNYNFREFIDWADVQVGGNVRRYDLFSNNTVFNESPDGGEAQRITIDEFGVYTQISKRLVNDRLKITASIRYDKNENFAGQVTPRASVVYSAGNDRQHNFRASYQTGFRNPDTQAQFIYFRSSSGILLGGTRANAERYGIMEGGGFNAPANVPNRQRVNLNYVQPEQLQAFEVGYKSTWLNGDLYIDANVYYNIYNNFIAGQPIYSENATTQRGVTLPAGTLFRVSTNVKQEITAGGVGLEASYRLPRNFIVSANADWAQFNVDIPTGSLFEPGFNTPSDRYNFALTNRELFKNFGFAFNYRWQNSLRWESSFGTGVIPAFGTFDAQFSYKVKAIKSVVKLGGTNILGNDYRTNFGGPSIGNMYYLSIRFDQNLN
jgi:outer membrane receptor protein involved in Fe transport